MTATPRPAHQVLAESGLDPHAVLALVRAALEEDLALGPDVTSEATVPAEATCTGVIAARAPGVLAGLPVAELVFQTCSGGAVRTHRLVEDGTNVSAGQPVLRITGPTRAVLTAERTALNLLCHLCGVATQTRAWVEAVAGTGATIRDTRKTTPGLRALEKYAVRRGGGTNHRMGLGDAALVKDNHLAATGGVAAALARLGEHAPGIPVEVECDTVEQVREAIAAGARQILLDNMGLADLRAAVALARAAARTGDAHAGAAAPRDSRTRAPGITLEASGGLTLATARAVAETGVDFLAVGALTHSAPALDLGLDLETPATATRPGGTGPGGA